MDFELTTMSYGKYKGMSIKDIFEMDPKYARWIFHQPTTTIYPNIYNFLKSKFKNENDFWFDFGKYKNHSLSEIILKKDIKYLFILRDMPIIKFKKEYKKLHNVLTEMLNDIDLNPDHYY